MILAVSEALIQSPYSTRKDKFLASSMATTMQLLLWNLLLLVKECHGAINDPVITSGNTIVMATRRGIFFLEEGQSTWRRLALPVHSSAVALGYHVTQDRLFWADLWGRSICSAHRNGSDVIVVRKLNPASQPSGLAVDSRESVVFYSDQYAGIIAAMATDGSSHRVVVSRVASPGALAVDQNRRWLYYVEQGPPASVRRVLYDGGPVCILVTTPYTWPAALALDLAAQRVLWCDYDFNGVQSVPIEGSAGKEVVVTSPALNGYMCPINLQSGVLLYSQFFRHNNSYCLWRSGAGHTAGRMLGSCLPGLEGEGREVFDILVAPSWATPVISGSTGFHTQNSWHVDEVRSPKHSSAAWSLGSVLGMVVGLVVLAAVLAFLPLAIIRRARCCSEDENHEGAEGEEGVHSSLTESPSSPSSRFDDTGTGEITPCQNTSNALRPDGNAEDTRSWTSCTSDHAYEEIPAHDQQDISKMQMS